MKIVLREIDLRQEADTGRFFQNFLQRSFVDFIIVCADNEIDDPGFESLEPELPFGGRRSPSN